MILIGLEVNVEILYKIDRVKIIQHHGTANCWFIHCIAIIHYSELGHIYDDPDRFFKYDDYIGSSTTEGVLVDGETVTDVEFFNVYIPFIYYENSTGTTIGAEFKMDITDQFIDSTVAGTPGDIRTKYIKYRYL